MPQKNPFLPAFHHCSLIVTDTAKALLFYQGILGLKVDHGRPDLGYPGSWLTIGGGQIHLLELPDGDIPVGQTQYGGKDRHLALQVKDLAVLIDKLERAGIRYSKSKSGRKALFCQDYDNNSIELIESKV